MYFFNLKKVLFAMVFSCFFCSSAYADEFCYTKVGQYKNVERTLRTFELKQLFRDGFVLRRPKTQSNSYYIKLPMRFVDEDKRNLCVSEDLTSGYSILDLYKKPVGDGVNETAEVKYVYLQTKNTTTHQNKHDISVDVGGFWVRIDGTQLSNDTEGDLVSYLSPFYDIKYAYKSSENTKYQISYKLKNYLFDSVDTRQQFDELSYSSNSLGLTYVRKRSDSLSYHGALFVKQELEYTSPLISLIDMNVEWVAELNLGLDYNALSTKRFDVGLKLDVFYQQGFELIKNAYGADLDIYFRIPVFEHHFDIGVQYFQAFKKTEFVKMNQKELGFYLGYLLRF